MRVAATIALALWALLSPGPAQSQEESCGARLPTDRTTIDLRGADVQTTLRTLAERYRVSLIVTPAATGVVTVSLYEVPVGDAFDALVRTGGLVCEVRDDILVVMLRKEAEAAREQQRKEEEATAKLEQARSAGEAEARKRQVEARREELALAEQQARGPLREETIRLAYADPEEIVRTLRGLLGFVGGVAPPPGAPGGPPLIAAPPFSALYGVAPPPPGVPEPTLSAEVLAKGITIQAHKPTNSIFIRHYEADLERIKKVIREKLDVPLPQVKITARLNELNRIDFFAIGVSWGGASLGRTPHGDVLVGQGFAGRTPPTTGIAPAAPGILGSQGGSSNPNLTLGSFLPVSAASGLPSGGNIVNFPVSPTGSFAGITPAGIAFGLIARKLNINLVLDALEVENKTTSLAKPEVVTLENAKATISLGSELPYSTVSSAGTQVQFKEALLKLEVTPTVIREGNVTRIKMVVNVENNSRGEDVLQTTTGAAATFIPAINKRTAMTQVVVNEGETLAIGGIRQQDVVESIQKVPFFGDIPFLGWLFKSKSRTTSPNRELVVFITPTILPTERPR